jgi:hypothetical protein
MSFIEFLDAHFLGMSLTLIVIVGISQLGRCVIAATTTKTISQVASRHF